VREAETQYAQFQIVFPAAPAGHPDVAALRMATKILAGSENGRLQRDLYATSRNVLDVTATYSAQELDGLVYVTVLCRPEADLQDLYDRVMKGIASMRDAEPSDLELQMGRNLAEMEYFTPLENLGGFGGRADAVNLANLMTGDPASGFDMVTGMAQVSPFAIRRVADTYFDPAHAVVVCIVPTGSLRKAIRTL
jgi:zinc protease